VHRIETDVVVIGAGTAGLAAYRAAAAAGRRALIVESGPGGTTCARVGCMPSKLLIAAAEAAHGVERWQEFGLRLDGALRIDGSAVMARVRRERDRFVGFVLEGVQQIPAADRLQGRARFTGTHALQVDAHTEVSFRSAVIATGSSPAVPPVLRGAGDRLVVNDDIFDWQDLPRSVAVFGPGVIGLELGQALSRLGVRVRMFGVGGLVGPFADPVVRRYARDSMAREFPLDPDAKVESVRRTDKGVSIRFVDSGMIEEESFDYLLAATGRTPNLKGLGLETTGLPLDARGVPQSRTHIRKACRVFPGNAALVGRLVQQRQVVVGVPGDEDVRFRDTHGLPVELRRTPLAVVFTEPQMAVVGMRYTELPAGRTVTGEVSFEDQGRSRLMLRNRGLAHVYAEAGSGRVLGAELIGPDAEHLAHLLAWGVQTGMSVERMLGMPFYHPVVEEGLRTALRDAQHKLATAARKAA